MPSEISIQAVLGTRVRYPHAVVRPDEFVLGAPRPLEHDAFLAHPRLGLFAIDWRSDRAQFVVVDDPIADRARPFLYEAQRASARALVSVPITQLLQWSEREPSPAPFLCYATARSGSTLLVRALDHIPGVHGISEPDVFTQLAEAAALRSDPRAVPLLRACGRWLFGGAGRPCGRLALKFRTQVLALAPLLQQAWPDAPTVFIHRALVPSVESFVQAFVGVERWRLERVIGLRSLVQRWLRFRIDCDGCGFPEHLWPPPGRPPSSALAELGPAYRAVAYWLSAWGWVERLRGDGVDVLAIEYDALVSAPEATIARVLAHCGLAVEHAACALPAFAAPSQCGSKVVRARDATPRLSSRDVVRLRELVRRYGEPNGLPCHDGGSSGGTCSH